MKNLLSTPFQKFSQELSVIFQLSAPLAGQLVYLTTSFLFRQPFSTRFYLIYSFPLCFIIYYVRFIICFIKSRLFIEILDVPAVLWYTEKVP